MLKVYFDCHDQYINIMKREFYTYFQDIEYLDVYGAEEKIVMIMEIHTDKDIKRIIRKNNRNFVFLIDNGTYMFELLEYEPLAFIRIQDIHKDLQKLIRILRFENKGIGVMLDFKTGFQKIRIDAENIEYIESFGHYLFIHTRSATFKVREKISDILKRLESLGFQQVHKSYIINQKYIKKQTAKELILFSDIRIPLGDKYKKNMKSKNQKQECS